MTNSLLVYDQDQQLRAHTGKQTQIVTDPQAIGGHFILNRIKIKTIWNWKSKQVSFKRTG